MVYKGTQRGNIMYILLVDKQKNINNWVCF